jgi:hypothetical protein
MTGAITVIRGALNNVVDVCAVLVWYGEQALVRRKALLVPSYT